MYSYLVKMFQNQGVLLQNLISRNSAAVVKKENKTANVWFQQESATVSFSDEAKKMLDNLEKHEKTVESVSPNQQGEVTKKNVPKSLT